MLKDKPRKMFAIIISTILFLVSILEEVQYNAPPFLSCDPGYWKAIKVIRLLAAMILSELNPISIKEMHIPNRKYVKDWQCRRRASDISKSEHGYVTNQWP